MKRTPLKRTPMKRRRKPSEFTPEVREKVMLRNGGQCEAGLKCCTGGAQDWHHRQRRQPGNTTVENGAALCRACHDFVTFTSPKKGRELGLVVRADHPDPGAVPMCVRGTWYMLLPSGGYERTEKRP